MTDGEIKMRQPYVQVPFGSPLEFKILSNAYSYSWLEIETSLLT